MFLSAPDNINDGENDDPEDIHEMPVHGEHFDSARLIPVYAAGHDKDHHDQKYAQPSRDVKGVQSYERVIGCPEEVRGDREAFS